ncbi:MAG: rhodanese-like domain-containing protein [Gemmatimonadetes bacterium]|nr:rhodanese-like domain-containing protein [Gemmatimonadota bacterium]MXY80789.1 rhodanese-like domain-containing protein [Gemmatimonadota bacterium]MYB72024.1 rhodanese-like domain-containing protein [Gemmatimonadota bacterium]
MRRLFTRIGLIVWLGVFAGLLFLLLSTPSISPHSEPYGINAPIGQLLSGKVISTISVSVAKQNFDTRIAVFLDARPAPFYAMGHIPGALNLSDQSSTAHLRQVLSPYSKDAKIIAYCSGGGCQSSSTLAKRLVEESVRDEVYVLTGGWPAWQAAGFPVAEGEEAGS